MEIVKIKSIRKKMFNGYVFNLAVEKDESYVANDIAVHNCRSILVPVLSDEKFEEDELPDLSLLTIGFGA